ncbi:MAG: DUF4430 domain-containing protein [Oscillospiraceae bacterium]|nr:DUF4430 domain-containing protein [Oscillospiraceae bacterium]
MKNKKTQVIVIVVAALLLLALAGGMVFAYLASREGPNPGEKTVTVTVVHKNGDEKKFTCYTEEEYLGPLLVAEGIVEDNRGEFGLYILVADGELADYNADGGWWKIVRNGEDAMIGADEMPIQDGDKIEVVYTVGF